MYLLALLRCLLSLTTLQCQHFCFPFWFCLNFFGRCSFLLTASGTWHFIIVYMYIQQVVMWHWPPLNAEVYLPIAFFSLRLDVIFLTEWSLWVSETNCMNVRWKQKTTLSHPSVLNLTLDMYSSCPKDEEVEWMNVLNFFAVFRNLSLCDKARVAFNQSQVKGLAGSPSESDKKSTKKR